MDDFLSVNDLLAEKNSYEGQTVYVGGLLLFDFEENCLNHWPRSEIDPHNWYKSSIWISGSQGIDELNQSTLSNWHGKRVVVAGKIKIAGSNNNCCGHMSLWPAKIMAHRIELFKNWIKNHP